MRGSPFPCLIQLQRLSLTSNPFLHLMGHASEQTLGDNEGQGNLACCGPGHHRVGHDLATEYQQQVSSYIFTAGNAPSISLLPSSSTFKDTDYIGLVLITPHSQSLSSKFSLLATNLISECNSPLSYKITYSQDLGSRKQASFCLRHIL